MAWVKQIFEAHGLKVTLWEGSVSLDAANGFGVQLSPPSRSQAHDQALMLRRAARRLEEIGEGLPQ